MKKVFTILVFATVMIACNNKSEKKTQSPPKKMGDTTKMIDPPVKKK